MKKAALVLAPEAGEKDGIIPLPSGEQALLKSIIEDKDASDALKAVEVLRLVENVVLAAFEGGVLIRDVLLPPDWPEETRETVKLVLNAKGYHVPDG